jgi:hypothetical protein
MHNVANLRNIYVFGVIVDSKVEKQCIGVDLW